MNSYQPQDQSKIKTWAQAAVFYFIGLSIFFIAAFVIISLRISYRGEVRVPVLVGKTYLEEHNHLQENGFEIKLQTVHSTNYPYGYIISQSLSPGKVVKFGQKIVLLVNQSKNILKTPLLIGSSDSVAPKILGNIHSGKRSFRLVPGVVTRIPSKRPKGEILAQYPLPGTPVHPDHPVSYLVSEGSSRETVNLLQQKKPDGYAQKKAMSDFNLKNKGLNVEIVKSMSYHLQVPLEIQGTSVKNFEQDGIVLQGELMKPTPPDETPVWKIQVGDYDDREDAHESSYPFRFIWVDAHELSLEQGRYTIVQSIGAKNIPEDLGLKIPLFSYLSLKEGQKIPLFKTFRDRFFIWDGRYQAFTHDPDHQKILKKPKEVYRPDE